MRDSSLKDCRVDAMRSVKHLHGFRRITNMRQTFSDPLLLGRLILKLILVASLIGGIRSIYTGFYPGWMTAICILVLGYATLVKTRP